MTRPEGSPVARSQRTWPLLVVVVGLVAGLLTAVVGTATWRAGSLVIGASLLVGALERLVLPTRAAGLLQVRSKGFDVAVLAVAGAAVVVLGVAVPNGH